jgi:hypothetical protein
MTAVIETLNLLLCKTGENGHDIALIFPDESGDFVRGYVAGQVDALRLAPEPAQGTQAADYLTDEDCLKKLVDTGFIMINPRIKDEVVYITKKGHSVLDVFDELVKMTGSELRARAIMIQNMTKVEGTLNNHRPKHSLKT